jgi:hypothetical protein
MISNRRLYTDRTRTLILEDGDVRVAWLLVGANSPYNRNYPFGLNVDEYLKKYPRKEDAPPPDLGEANTTDNDMQPETKSVNAPPSTKAVQSDKTKTKK